MSQVSGGDDSADQVCCSFFGDGTANIGAPCNPLACTPAIRPCRLS